MPLRVDEIAKGRAGEMETLCLGLPARTAAKFLLAQRGAGFVLVQSVYNMAYDVRCTTCGRSVLVLTRQEITEQDCWQCFVETMMRVEHPCWRPPIVAQRVRHIRFRKKE